MSDKKANQRARRRLLKVLSLGTAAASGKLVPDAWTRPVVASVMLPAHAVATGEVPVEPPCRPQFSYSIVPNGTIIGGFVLFATAVFDEVPDGIGYLCNWTVPGTLDVDHTATATSGVLLCTATSTFTCRGEPYELAVALQNQTNSVICGSEELDITRTCPS